MLVKFTFSINFSFSFGFFFGQIFFLFSIDFFGLGDADLILAWDIYNI
jgi:hypothetical protein